MRETTIHPFDSLVEVYTKPPYSEISTKRAQRIIKIIEALSFKPLDVLDIGCGSGIGTSIFKKAGYKVRGIDISLQSLIRAKDKCISSFSQQDMRFLGFKNESFDLITSVFDSLNYITEEELDRVLSNCFRCLRKGGLIVLDFLTPAAFIDTEGRSDSIYTGDGFYFLSTALKEQQNQVKLILTAFLEVNQDRHIYKKVTETHTLQLFSVEKIVNSLEKEGFTILEKLDGENEELATDKSWHSLTVAQKLHEK